MKPSRRQRYLYLFFVVVGILAIVTNLLALIFNYGSYENFRVFRMIITLVIGSIFSIYYGRLYKRESLKIQSNTTAS